jgi:hypothetical protein
MVTEVSNKTTGSFSVENVNSPAADAAYQLQVNWRKLTNNAKIIHIFNYTKSHIS